MWLLTLIAGAGRLARVVPWQLWLCIAVAFWAWRYREHVITTAMAAGYKAGYETSDSKWVKAAQANAITAQVAYMQREARMWGRLLLSYNVAEQRISAITHRATTLQGQLNAIRAADPPKPECQLSAERVRWANCALGYTYACTGVQ